MNTFKEPAKELKELFPFLTDEQALLIVHFNVRNQGEKIEHMLSVNITGIVCNMQKMLSNMQKTLSDMSRKVDEIEFNFYQLTKNK